jgi:hypothetical protein
MDRVKALEEAIAAAQLTLNKARAEATAAGQPATPAPTVLVDAVTPSEERSSTYRPQTAADAVAAVRRRHGTTRSEQIAAAAAARRGGAA